MAEPPAGVGAGFFLPEVALGLFAGAFLVTLAALVADADAVDLGGRPRRLGVTWPAPATAMALRRARDACGFDDGAGFAGTPACLGYCLGHFVFGWWLWFWF